MKRLLAILALSASSGVQAEPSQAPTHGLLHGLLIDQDKNLEQIQPGMRADLAIQLLGRSPDQTTEIGAACGMLEILSWQDEQTKIITSGGIISSVIGPDTKKDAR